MDNKIIEIKIWGARGSIATPQKANIHYGGNTSCVQIISDLIDGVLIMDCGSGLVNLGNQLVQSTEPVNGRIFVTHTHWDHVQGIPFFKPFYQKGNSFSLHMREQMGESCQEIVKMVMAPVFFPVSVDAFHADINFVTDKGDPQKYQEGYSVSSLKTAHPGNTVAYKVTIRDKVIVYCPDNEYEMTTDEHRARMLDFFSNADVLIHDSQYDRETYPPKKGWGHSAWENAVEMAAECGVKNLLLVHHDPESDDGDLMKRSYLLEPYQSRFSHIEFARENGIFRLEF